MSAPVLSWLFIALGKAFLRRSPALRGAARRVRSCPQSPLAAATSFQRPPGPTLRANPFPEVTDLFCRLPLPTFFYRLEATNLGDLRRIWVRPGVRISHATGFSRDVESAPKRPKDSRLSQTANPFSGQSDSRLGASVNKKRKLFSGLPLPSPALLVLPLGIHVLVREY